MDAGSSAPRTSQDRSGSSSSLVPPLFVVTIALQLDEFTEELPGVKAFRSLAARRQPGR